MIAVHVGAGYHSQRRRHLYKEACKEACMKSNEMLKNGCSAVEAITMAVSILEDCPITNAGYGSNLNLEGKVELDAGIMDGSSLNFASVGSLSHVKNPIKVVQKILEQQGQGLLSGGRIPPCTLVGSGALNFATRHGFKHIHDKDLISKNAKQSYIKYIRHIGEKDQITAEPNLLPDIEPPLPTLMDNLMDTVGAVCIDKKGNICSATSSGGILLKYPGRVGPSCMFGTGLWAKNSTDNSKPSMACVVSGSGEYLIKTLFAKEWCEAMSQDNDSITILQDTFQRQFLDSPFLSNISSKLAGVLSVKHFKDDASCDLAWVHNTKTMILGYMTTELPQPESIFSAQLLGPADEKAVVCCEKRIKL